MQHNSEKERKFNIAELSTLKFCKHPNIVNYFCSYKMNNEIWVSEYLHKIDIVVRYGISGGWNTRPGSKIL